jgi:hypothetical protein
MARSTLPAAFLAPAAATFSLLLTVRFALPMALFASTSVAFARRCTLAVAARVLFTSKVRAFSAPRLASVAAAFARFTSEPPMLHVLFFVASTASPISSETGPFAHRSPVCSLVALLHGHRGSPRTASNQSATPTFQQQQNNPHVISSLLVEHLTTETNLTITAFMPESDDSRFTSAQAAAQPTSVR